MAFIGLAPKETLSGSSIKGKNGKVIVCAIMRKLVHVIFGVLKSGKKYDQNYQLISA
jgi:hypothetical protein